MANLIPLKFDFVQDGRLLRSERLALQDHLKVGKLSSSNLRIDDPAVSRMHAVIERRDPDLVELLDLGSTRGTTVNGERIDRRVLRSGDRLQFGTTEVVVYIGEVDIAAADRAAATGQQYAAPPFPGAPRSVETPRLGGPPPLGGVSLAKAAPGFEAPRLPGMPPPPPVPGIAAQGPPIEAPPVDDPTGRRAVEISFLWGESVLRVDHYQEPKDITIGGAISCNYYVDPHNLGVDTFPLIKVVGTALALTFNDHMTGLVRISEQETLTLEELKRTGRALPCEDAPGAVRFLLPDTCRCKVSYGDQSFLINLVIAPRKIVAPLAMRISPTQILAFAVAILFWGFLQTMFFLAIPEEEGFLIDSFDAANRFAQLMVIPEKKKEPEIPDWLKKKQEEEAKKAAEAAKKKPTKMGDENSKQVNKKVAIKGEEKEIDPQIKKAEMIEKVKQTGALAALSQDNELAVIFGASKNIGSDAVNAMGNYTGDGIGNAAGFGGLALSGAGRGGGGGLGEGSLGVGGLGTRGRAGGRADYGRGVGDLGDRSGGIPQVTAGKPVVTGALDREIIRRIIGKHRDAIKYCYEKELATNKDLSGKVVVFFTIAPTGTVVAASIKESTLKNPAAEQCILTRVQKWVFPQPSGGGIVEVTYPFIFKSI